jgi:hypothetical protein
MGVADSPSLRFDSYVRMQHFVRRTRSIPFRRFGGGVRREFMQRLFAALHGTLGYYLRDALQKGIADVVACLHVPRAGLRFFPLFFFMLGCLRYCFFYKNFVSIHTRPVYAYSKIC